MPRSRRKAIVVAIAKVIIVIVLTSASLLALMGAVARFAPRVR